MLDYVRVKSIYMHWWPMFGFINYIIPLFVFFFFFYIYKHIHDISIFESKIIRTELDITEIAQRRTEVIFIQVTA